MTQSVQTLIAQSQRSVRVAGDCGLLFEFCLAGVLIGLRIDIVAAEKAFHRTMVATGVAGLVAGRKRVVDIALEPKCLAADGMDNRMTIAPQLRIVRFETLDQLQRLGGCVMLEGLAEKIIETLGAVKFL